jgi:ribosomal protein S27AE
MSSETNMICPVCGHEMNHHAEKLIAAFPEEPGYNTAFSGVLEESHACPNCGAAASRLALSTP